MGIFDGYQFEQPGGFGGWLGQALRMANPDAMNPAGMPGAVAQQPGFGAMAQAPMAQMAPQMPQQQEPSFLNNIGNFLSNNSNTLMSLGAGIAGGRNWGEGISAGLTGAQKGRTQDQTMRAQMGLYQALLSRGLDHPTAMAAMTNPELLKAVMLREPHNVGNVVGAWDKTTGKFNPQFAAPEIKSVSPGDNLVSVSAFPMPGQPAATTIATGGPPKPPANYEWVDPNNPKKGVTAIPGSSATELPGNTGAFVAMMDAARPGVQEARKYFIDKDQALMLKGGVTGPVGQMVGQRMNAFEIGRQQRNVRLGVEAALRAMTGAAAPETEVKRYSDMFTPSVYDAIETRQQKLDALEQFMTNARANIMRGRTTADEQKPSRIKIDATGNIIR